MDHELVDAGGDVFKKMTLHQGRDPARYFHVLDGPPHLPTGFLQRLATFHSDGAGEIFEALFQKILELEEMLDALGRGNTAPRLEGERSGPSRVTNFHRRTERNPSQHVCGGGVRDL
jgi:hypothetical protein